MVALHSKNSRALTFEIFSFVSADSAASLAHALCQVQILKSKSSIVALYSKYSMALTFENLCNRQCNRLRVLDFHFPMSAQVRDTLSEAAKKNLTTLRISIPSVCSSS
jgi:hypothetical protein